MHILKLLYVYPTLACLLWTALTVFVCHRFKDSWVRHHIMEAHPTCCAPVGKAPPPGIRQTLFWLGVSLVPLLNAVVFGGWALLVAYVASGTALRKRKFARRRENRFSV